MSVNKEYSNAIAEYANKLWQSFSPDEKMRRTKTASVEDAETRFSQANAADKHIYTL